MCSKRFTTCAYHGILLLKGECGKIQHFNDDFILMMVLKSKSYDMIILKIILFKITKSIFNINLNIRSVRTIYKANIQNKQHTPTCAYYNIFLNNITSFNSF